jgi:FtsZ-binding cell division protein ZapB
MDTLDRLEDVIKRYVEAYQILREEKEHLSGELVLFEAELGQARDTIRNLRLELEKFAAEDVRYREFEARREELREYIKTVIDKIDRYGDTDAMGAVTNA